MYCKDDHSSSRLSGHMCNKDEIPKTEDTCRGMSCNEIKLAGNRYDDAINSFENDESGYKVYGIEI